MDAFSRIKLRLVPRESIRPHEIADPAREQRIEGRLREDRVLRDPLMVAEVGGVPGYVLLDGTNRTLALTSLGLPYALAQIIDYADEHAVQLRTWCHAADHTLDDLTEAIAHIQSLFVKPVALLGARDVLREPHTLALLLDRDGQYAVVQEPDSESSAVNLRRLVHLYESSMQRVDCGPDDVEERAQSLSPGTTLVAFPGFTRSQVITMAMRGVLIPAGITRHVILVGRALRVNVPLWLLSGDRSLAEANEELQGHLQTLQPRLYRESTILYDS